MARPAERTGAPMIQAPSSILVDTNVCLDNFLADRDGSQTSQVLIDACREKGVDVLFSIFTLRDVYYHVEAHLKRQIREAGEDVTSERAAIAEQFAWQAMLSLNEQGTAVPADTSDVTVARYFHQVHRDFEDDLVLAAVERSGADYLITNDKKLRAHAPVAAITPTDMLTLLKAADDA